MLWYLHKTVSNVHFLGSIKMDLIRVQWVSVSKEAQRNRKKVVQLVTSLTLIFALPFHCFPYSRSSPSNPSRCMRLPSSVLASRYVPFIYIFFVISMFQIGSHILAYSNFCMNPIFYAFLSPPFFIQFQVYDQLLKSSTKRKTSRESSTRLYGYKC